MLQSKKLKTPSDKTIGLFTERETNGIDRVMIVSFLICDKEITKTHPWDAKEYEASEETTIELVTRSTNCSSYISSSCINSRFLSGTLTIDISTESWVTV